MKKQLELYRDFVKFTSSQACSGAVKRNNETNDNVWVCGMNLLIELIELYGAVTSEDELLEAGDVIWYLEKELQNFRMSLSDSMFNSSYMAPDWAYALHGDDWYTISTSKCGGMLDNVKKVTTGRIDIDKQTVMKSAEDTVIAILYGLELITLKSVLQANIRKLCGRFNLDPNKWLTDK